MIPRMQTHATTARSAGGAHLGLISGRLGIFTSLHPFLQLLPQPPLGLHHLSQLSLSLPRPLLLLLQARLRLSKLAAKLFLAFFAAAQLQLQLLHLICIHRLWAAMQQALSITTTGHRSATLRFIKTGCHQARGLCHRLSCTSPRPGLYQK